MTEPPRAVVFDVDGTLVDTNYLHTVAWWHAFRDSGYDGVEMATIHRCIGMGADGLIEKCLGEYVDHAEVAHKHRYAPNLEQLTPLDGAVELLLACADLGLRVVLASSASAEEVDALTRALHVAEDAWTAFTGSADAEGGKPQPDIVQAALEAADVRPEDAVMVGDAVWDVISSDRAGLACIGVQTGGLAASELREAGAVAVYESPRALLDALESSPVGVLARGERVARDDRRWSPTANDSR